MLQQYFPAARVKRTTAAGYIFDARGKITAIQATATIQLERAQGDRLQHVTANHGQGARLTVDGGDQLAMRRIGARTVVARQQPTYLLESYWS